MNDFQLATVVSRTTAGVKIQLDGSNTPLQKDYRSISTGVTLKANDRVLVVKHSGTYIVIGKIV